MRGKQGVIACNVLLWAVTAQDVERLKGKLAETPAKGRKDPADLVKERPRTPTSVNRFLQDLRAAFNLARVNGKAEKNPVADVKPLRENNKRIREITDAEEKVLVGALAPAGRRGGTDLRRCLHGKALAGKWPAARRNLHYAVVRRGLDRRLSHLAKNEGRREAACAPEQ